MPHTAYRPFDDSPAPASAAAPRAVPLPLLPVAAPARIWAAVKREYGSARVEQLPARARMLEVLEHMQRGNLLALMGAVVWLDGQQDIALLAGVLFCYGYVEIAGRHRDNPDVVYFRLSDAGCRKLNEGRAWWRSLSLRQKLHVRLFG